VTGANAGLGKECARHLGLKDGVAKVLLACRDSEKAVAAKTNLEESTQKQDVYEIVIIDMATLIR
jgi:NADP-dependent 3-hydroxy acid dehydrogenase YdfG